MLDMGELRVPSLGLMSSLAIMSKNLAANSCRSASPLFLNQDPVTATAATSGSSMTFARFFENADP